MSDERVDSDPTETDVGATRPSYEQARDELVDVVRRLEAGGVTLEESLRLWQRGEALAEICQSWLDGARRQLDRARPADDGAPAPADEARGRSAGSAQ
jgi:exodeoxyribonuclease VII small subunit